MSQFDLNKYPTLNAMAQSDAFIKFCIGPAGCLPRECEVLTPTGWVSIAEAPPVILIYDKNSQTASFQEAEHVKLPCKKFHRFKNSYALDMPISDEHKVWYTTHYSEKRGGFWQVTTGAELAEQWLAGTKRNARVPTVFMYMSDGEPYPLTDDELRVSVMLSADGYLPPRGEKATVTVRKERKKARVRELLNKCGIPFTESVYANRPTETSFRFVPPEFNKDLTRFYSCTAEQLAVIASESLLWDGSIGEKGSYYCSGNKRNADFIQFAFCATGIPSVLTEETYPEELGWNPTYRATYAENKKTAWANMKTCEYEEYLSTDGFKYCYTTNTGMFVVRFNGKVFCTGNSAKTSFCVLELFRRACMQAPAADKVRYSRTLVGRNTYQVLKSATIPTFENMLGFLGESVTFKKGSFPPTAHIRGRLADDTFVHWDIEFVSFDSDDAVSKLLGYEPTNAMLDEISELPEELIDSVVRRLGRYPSGIKGRPTWVGLLGATNGPRKDHWLYRWYLGERDKEFAKIEKQTGRKQFELFRQPPALLERADGEWVPNPEAENIENLPNGYGYYYNMLSGDRERVRSYVEGDFADIVTGKVVYPEFRRDFHVWVNGHQKLPHSMRLYLGFDFGRTPVCVIATATSSGKLIVIDEVMGEDISIDTLCTDYLLPVLRQKYPRSTIEGAWGDPAGNVETQAIDISPFDVLLKHGIPIEDPGGNNKLHPRLEAVKQRFKHLDDEGRPSLLITDNCKYIIDAIGSTYIYENVRGRNDTVRDVPTKSHEGWCSDLADALSYLCMGYNSLVGVRRTNRRDLAPLRRSTI